MIFFFSAVECHPSFLPGNVQCLRWPASPACADGWGQVSLPSQFPFSSFSPRGSRWDPGFLLASPCTPQLSFLLFSALNAVSLFLPPSSSLRQKTTPSVSEEFYSFQKKKSIYGAEITSQRNFKLRSSLKSVTVPPLTHFSWENANVTRSDCLRFLLSLVHHFGKNWIQTTRLTSHLLAGLAPLRPASFDAEGIVLPTAPSLLQMPAWGKVRTRTDTDVET